MTACPDIPLEPEQPSSSAMIRGELEQMRVAIGRIEAVLGGLDETQRRSLVLGERPQRYLRVLVEVYERGGQPGVDADGLAAIGERHGYDRRGLGGFFTGARAPLQRVGGRIRLSPYGAALMDAFLARSDT